MEQLFRAAARRTELTAEGKPVLAKQDQQEWFLDLAAGLQSLTTAVAYAAPAWRRELTAVLQRYGKAVWEVTQKGLDLPESPSVATPYAGLEQYDEWAGDVTQIAWVAAQRVQEIAMLDLAGYESRQAAIAALAHEPAAGVS